jgi:DNA-binding SARP family transcriptional activator
VGEKQVGVSIRVLGPVEVRVDGRVIKCTGRQRDLLVRLVIQRSDRRAKLALISDLYGPKPIRTADAAYRVVLAQLRESLKPYEDVVLVGSLYGLDAESELLNVDAWTFSDACQAGSLLLQNDQTHDAAQVLQTALALWRGDAFGGVTRLVQADDEMQRLEQLRESAREDLADAQIALGNARDVVDKLCLWAESSPDRERLRGLHLLALYKSSRQRECFQAIQKLHDDTADAGLVLSPWLAQLCKDLYQQTPEVNGLNVQIPSRLELQSGTIPPILDAAHEGFAGRKAALNDLVNSKKTVHLLVGRPGIGKTALLGEATRQLLQQKPGTLVAYCPCAPDDYAGLSSIRRGLGITSSVNEPANWEQQITETIELVDRYLENGPLLLIVDDIHWADEQTSRFLRRLAARHDEELRFICAGRPSVQVELLSEIPTTKRTQLHPLTQEETLLATENIQQQLALTNDPVVSFDNPTRTINSNNNELLWKMSGGYPLLLRAATIMLTRIRSSSENLDHNFDLVVLSDSEDPEIAEAMGVVVHQLLRSLNPEAQHLAVIAALLGHQVDEDILALTSGQELHVVRDAVNSFIGLGLVEGPYPFHFRHRSLADAVLLSIHPMQIAEIRQQIVLTEDLPITTRAKHALLCVPNIEPSTALTLSRLARNEARASHRNSELSELSKLEAVLFSVPKGAETDDDFTRLTDLAFSQEALGNVSAGEQHRQSALEMAERAGNFDWAVKAVLTPPAQGRPLAAGRSNSYLSRVIALANPNTELITLARLRAERVHRLALAGSYRRLPEGEISWLKALKENDVGSECWAEVARALLCSELAAGPYLARLAMTQQMAKAMENSANTDLKVDSLVLKLRCELETHDREQIDNCLHDIDSLLLHTGRPMDEWMRNVMRSTVFASRGELSTAYGYAKEAHSIGSAHTIADSEITWQLQSLALLAIDPSLGRDCSNSKPGIESTPIASTTEALEVLEAEALEGNLLALGLAMHAEGLAAAGDLGSAAEFNRAAQDLLDSESLDNYFLPASACIAHVAFLTRTPVDLQVQSTLAKDKKLSLIIGMIPGWSLGPALRYESHALFANGNHIAALKQMNTSVNLANKTGQRLAEASSLADLILMETEVLGAPKPETLKRHRTVHDRLS